MKVWNNILYALLPFKSWCVALFLSFGSVSLFNYLPCQLVNSSAVSDELWFCVLLCASELSGAVRWMELLCHCHLPESLDRRNLLVIVASSPNWVTGMSPGCFLCLDLFISGIQFLPIIVCFSLRRVKCLWLEVFQFHHPELKQSDFCIPWGALHWLEISVRKNVVWILLSSWFPESQFFHILLTTM